MPTRSYRSALGLLLVLALAAAACGSGDDDDAAGPALGDGTTTTDTAVSTGADAGDGDPGPDDTEEPGADDSTPATTVDAGDGTVVDPGTEPRPRTLDDLDDNAYGAPKPGQHTYEDADGDRMLLDVFDTGDADGDFDRTGELTQLHITTVEREQRARLLRWTADGLLLVSEQRRAPDGSESATCDFEPALRIMPWPLVDGTDWQAEATCIATSGDTTLERTREIDGEVGGTSVITIAGTDYDGVFVTYTETTTTTSDTEPPLLLVERREVTDLFVPDLGLVGRSEGATFDTLGAAPGEGQSFQWVLLTDVGAVDEG